MNLKEPDISYEDKQLIELLAKTELSNDDINVIGYLLTAILTKFFSSSEKDLSFKSWSVDDMYPETVHRTSKKLTLKGNIHWLGGGGKCKIYQADISTTTSPILYSIKLQDKHERQILYIGKTFTGWVLNKH